MKRRLFSLIVKGGLWPLLLSPACARQQAPEPSPLPSGPVSVTIIVANRQADEIVSLPFTLTYADGIEIQSVTAEATVVIDRTARGFCAITRVPEDWDIVAGSVTLAGFAGVPSWSVSDSYGSLAWCGDVEAAVDATVQFAVKPHEGPPKP